MCGECCGAWKLPIEDELYKSIVELDWVKKILRETKADFEIINDQRYLPKQEGVCVFLDKADNCCGLHKKYGPTNKPVECNRFPFAFARDKSRKIYVDTSFYCKAIAEDIGPKVEDIVDEEYIKDFDVFSLPEVVAYTPMIDISLSKATDIRLVVSKYLYETCINRPIEEWADTFLQVFTALLRLEKFLKKKQDVEVEQLIQQAALINLDSKKVMFKQSLLTSFLLRKYNILPDIINLLFNCSKFKEPIIVEEVDLKQYKCVTFSDDPALKRLLLKYLLDINQRTILLGHGHSLVGVYIEMVVAYCLLKWYMKALAILEQSNVSEMFHLKLAIRIVERYYIGHNVRFLELFRKPITFIVLKSFLRT